MKQFSIIIPCSKRKQKVMELLYSLCFIDYNLNDIEVIIVENNFKDGTEELEKINWPFELKYSFLSSGIQGHSRNRGVELSCGTYILFLDSDVTVSKNILTEHEKMLREYSKCIIIGNVVFNENVYISPQARLYDVARYFKNFKHYEKKGVFSFIQCISCNLSIKKSNLENLCFNESFDVYGYEDIEFGYSAEKQGFSLHFCETAKVFHYHERTLKEFACRLYSMGKSALTLKKIHPEIEQKLDLGIFNAVHNPSVSVLLNKINIQNIEERILLYEKKYKMLCRKKSHSLNDIIKKKKLFYMIGSLYKKFYFYYKTKGIVENMDILNKCSKEPEYIQLSLF